MLILMLLLLLFLPSSQQKWPSHTRHTPNTHKGCQPAMCGHPSVYKQHRLCSSNSRQVNSHTGWYRGSQSTFLMEHAARRTLDSGPVCPSSFLRPPSSFLDALKKLVGSMR